MSPVGRWAAIGSATLGVLTIAAWDRGEPATLSDPTSVVDASAGSDTSGARLFRAKGSATCHDGPDSMATFDSGLPSLADAPSWAGERRPGLSAEDYLTESMAAPGVFISPEFSPGQSGPTTGMPQLSLTSDEIEALVDYLLDR